MTPNVEVISWWGVVGYAVMIGFFWLAWRGWCEDTRKMKKLPRRRHD